MDNHEQNCLTQASLQKRGFTLCGRCIFELAIGVIGLKMSKRTKIIVFALNSNLTGTV